MEAIDGKLALSPVSNFHPSHAVEFARHFRRTVGKEWSEETRDMPANWCELFQWADTGQALAADPEVKPIAENGQVGRGGNSSYDVRPKQGNRTEYLVRRS